MSSSNSGGEQNDSSEINPTLLAALYQVTARWYSNDAQLVWKRLTLFVTLNTGLITAQAFAAELHIALRLAMPVLGIIFSVTWYHLTKRMWSYQDYQAAILRDQERAMNLAHLGAFSRVFSIRKNPNWIEISGMHFSSSNLTGNFRNRHFTLAVFPVFVCFHSAFIVGAICGAKF